MILLMFSYHSISKASIGLYSEKKSKFISYAFHVTEKKQIRNSIDYVKKNNIKADHFPYAFILHDKTKEYGFSDDQEPSGSAGKPILSEIKAKGLVNIIIITARYFGGIKLGPSGLNKAFRESAICALKNTEIIEYIIYSTISIIFGYEIKNNVEYFILKHDIKVIKQTYNQKCILDLKVPKKEYDQFYNFCIKNNITICPPEDNV